MRVELEVLFHPGRVSSLFNATIKGTFRRRNISRLSMVCGSNPFIISTIRIAMSAAEPPLFLRLEKTACPGVSITSSPGKFISRPNLVNRSPQRVSYVSVGKKLAPIC